MVTSPADIQYNCIAWAAGDNTRWWWPTSGYYWPPNAPRKESIDAFLKAFELLGYARATAAALASDAEMVALYANAGGNPTHMARRLSSGHWTSKLGQNADVEHHDLASLEGGIYGHVAEFLVRNQSLPGN